MSSPAKEALARIHRNPEVKFYELIEQEGAYDLMVVSDPDKPARALYAIVNRNYGVIEMTTLILTNGKLLIKQLAKIAEDGLHETDPEVSQMELN